MPVGAPEEDPQLIITRSIIIMLIKIFQLIFTAFPSLLLVYFVSLKVALSYILFSDLSNSISLNISKLFPEEVFLKNSNRSSRYSKKKRVAVS